MFQIKTANFNAVYFLRVWEIILVVLAHQVQFIDSDKAMYRVHCEMMKKVCFLV